MSTLFDSSRNGDSCGVGFVTHLEGTISHHILTEALVALEHLAHRGGHISTDNFGDGAGLLLAMPQKFFKECWPILKKNTHMPWAVGQLFLPHTQALRVHIMDIVQQSLLSCGLQMIDGRDVPTCPHILHTTVRATMPSMMQILVTPTQETDISISGAVLEKHLYLARRRMEKTAKQFLREHKHDVRQFHVVSLSAHSIVYKALLPGARLAEFYPDLANPSFATSFAIFHQRFSNNRFSSWRTAQPLRMLAHNGEIRSLHSSLNHWLTHEPLLASSIFGDTLSQLLPIADIHGTDAMKLDNVCEFLTHCGCSLPQVLMTMLPEPFGIDSPINAEKKAFYEYHAPLITPWDGSSCLVFTDGDRWLGVMQDAQALRPCRYSISHSGLMVLASEIGILNEETRHIAQKGHLRPHSMLAVDLLHHRLLTDAEIKGNIVREKPYAHWRTQYGTLWQDITSQSINTHSIEEPKPSHYTAQKALFGYTPYIVKEYILPLAHNPHKPLLCQALPHCPAILHAATHTLFDYFTIIPTVLSPHALQYTHENTSPKSLDALVNLATFVGARQNPLEPQAEQCKTLYMEQPFLSHTDMQKLHNTEHAHICLHTLDAIFTPHKTDPHNTPDFTDTMSQHTTKKPIKTLGKILENALDTLHKDAIKALQNGATILIVSHKAASAQKATCIPIPSLLAISSLHTTLLRHGLRHLCGIIAEVGDAHTPLHMAQLLNGGADAIYPYLALHIAQREAPAAYTTLKPTIALQNYTIALQNGLKHILALLNISTLSTLKDGQYFEAVGICSTIIAKYFPANLSRLGGMNMEHIAYEASMRGHISTETQDMPECENTQETHTDNHNISMDIAHLLQQALQENNARLFRSYIALCQKRPCPSSLRTLLHIKDRPSIPLDTVESVNDIIKRFIAAAIPADNITYSAYQCLTEGFQHVGCSSCATEHNKAHKHLPHAAHIQEIDTDRKGIHAQWLVNCQEIQVAFVHEGGAPNSFSTSGQYDISSFEDMSQFIFDLKRLHPHVQICAKLPAQTGIGNIAVGMVKAGVHSLLISGCADDAIISPIFSHPHDLLPWEVALAEVQHALCVNRLRRRVRLRILGQLFTGQDILKATLLGAEEYVFPTTHIMALGCDLCHTCDTGPCPKGVNAKSPGFSFTGKKEYICRLLKFMAEDVRRVMAHVGFAYIDQMVGRADLLEYICQENTRPKTASLDLNILTQAASDTWGLRNSATYLQKQHASLQYTSAQRGGTPSYAPPQCSPLEEALLEDITPLLRTKTKACNYCGTVTTTDRAVGTHISGEVLRRTKGRTLSPHSYTIKLWGSAGQSLGAFLISGITLKVYGEANDHVGKGLSGGIIAISHAPDSPLIQKTYMSTKYGDIHHAHALIGNVALYGATAGEAYIAGAAGEYFAAYNHGASAVVEGVGDYACTHMQAGTVLILGTCGHYLANGMQGGTLYIYDPKKHLTNTFPLHDTNTHTYIKTQNLTTEDIHTIQHMLQQHVHYTRSSIAHLLLKDWDTQIQHFVRITPREC